MKSRPGLNLEVSREVGLSPLLVSFLFSLVLHAGAHEVLNNVDFEEGVDLLPIDSTQQEIRFRLNDVFRDNSLARFMLMNKSRSPKFLRGVYDEGLNYPSDLTEASFKDFMKEVYSRDKDFFLDNVRVTKFHLMVEYLSGEIDEDVFENANKKYDRYVSSSWTYGHNFEELRKRYEGRYKRSETNVANLLVDYRNYDCQLGTDGNKLRSDCHSYEDLHGNCQARYKLFAGLYEDITGKNSKSGTFKNHIEFFDAENKEYGGFKFDAVGISRKPFIVKYLGYKPIMSFGRVDSSMSKDEVESGLGDVKIGSHVVRIPYYGAVNKSSLEEDPILKKDVRSERKDVDSKIKKLDTKLNESELKVQRKTDAAVMKWKKFIEDGGDIYSLKEEEFEKRAYISMALAQIVLEKMGNDKLYDKWLREEEFRIVDNHLVSYIPSELASYEVKKALQEFMLWVSDKKYIYSHELEGLHHEKLKVSRDGFRYRDGDKLVKMRYTNIFYDRGLSKSYFEKILKCNRDINVDNLGDELQLAYFLKIREKCKNYPIIDSGEGFSKLSIQEKFGLYIARYDYYLAKESLKSYKEWTDRNLDSKGYNYYNVFEKLWNSKHNSSSNYPSEWLDDVYKYGNRRGLLYVDKVSIDRKKDILDSYIRLISCEDVKALDANLVKYMKQKYPDKYTECEYVSWPNNSMRNFFKYYIKKVNKKLIRDRDEHVIDFGGDIKIQDSSIPKLILPRCPEDLLITGDGYKSKKLCVSSFTTRMPRKFGLGKVILKD